MYIQHSTGHCQFATASVDLSFAYIDKVWNFFITFFVICGGSALLNTVLYLFSPYLSLYIPSIFLIAAGLTVVWELAFIKSTPNANLLLALTVAGIYIGLSYAYRDFFAAPGIEGVYGFLNTWFLGLLIAPYGIFALTSEIKPLEVELQKEAEILIRNKKLEEERENENEQARAQTVDSDNVISIFKHQK